MILKIAIVDDDLIFLKKMQETCHDFFFDKKMAVTIDAFRHHKLLMYELDEGTFYDLFLLDIEMKDKEINGIELAHSIRKINNKSYIIFITSHMQYTLQGYEVSAFRYIPKNKLEQKLPEALEMILESQEKRVKSFYLIETITKYIKLYYEDIYYIYTSLQLFRKIKKQTHVLYSIIKAINKNYTKRDEFVSTAYYT